IDSYRSCNSVSCLFHMASGTRLKPAKPTHLASPSNTGLPAICWPRPMSTANKTCHDRIQSRFSGDLGAPFAPLLSAPKPPYSADIVVLESTYGDRNHSNRPNRRRQLRQTIEPGQLHPSHAPLAQTSTAGAQGRGHWTAS